MPQCFKIKTAMESRDEFIVSGSLKDLSFSGVTKFQISCHCLGKEAGTMLSRSSTALLADFSTRA